MRRWRSEFGSKALSEALSADGALSTKGTSNSEALSAKGVMRRWDSKSRDFIGPKASCADGAPNPETLSVQKRHALMGVRIWRLFGQS
ncbi:hypothetical protein ACSBR2_021991 [Camellia fascicularis]